MVRVVMEAQGNAMFGHGSKITLFLLLLCTVAFADGDKRYGLINNQTGQCDNVVMWDGNPATWQVPDGYTAVQDDHIDIYQAPRQQPVSEVDNLKQELTDLKTEVDSQVATVSKTDSVVTTS